MSSPRLSVEGLLSLSSHVHLFLFLFFFHLILFHLQGWLPACLYVLHAHTWCPLMSEKGVWSLWNWSCKQL